MGTSLLRATSRLFAPVVAVALLAGVSQVAAGATPAYGQAGRLALQTGKTLSAFQVDFESYYPGGYPVLTPTTWWGVPPTGSSLLVPPQPFVSDGGCKIVLAPTNKVPSKQYVDIVPIGPTGAKTSSLGWVATSIGVYDGPNGTPCGRVSYDKGEAIEVKLGSDVPGDAFAFDRLELDVEVKGDVKLTMEVKFGSRVNQYHLWTGAAVGSAGADDEPRVLRPGDNVYRCKAASDSGPDSGASDNCRWIVEDVGSSFKITLEAGEFSLEGGGDHVDPLGNRSFIYLTEPDGILDCGQSADSVDTEDGVACTVDRLDNDNCTAVPYIFREISTASGQTCDFAADMGGQQLIANIFASYGIEPQEIGDPKTLGTWLPRPLSRVLFNNSPIDYPIPPCLGLTLTNIDLDPVPPFPPVGPDPIPEIDQTYDRVDTVATDDTIEFACAFMRREAFETDGLGNDWVRVKEGIQFWGDPSFSRPGISSN